MRFSQVRYASGMKTADAGMLRKAIVQKFLEEPDEEEARKKDAFCCQFCASFATKSNQFAKTGLGQTIGKEN